MFLFKSFFPIVFFSNSPRPYVASTSFRDQIQRVYQSSPDLHVPFSVAKPLAHQKRLETCGPSHYGDRMYCLDLVTGESAERDLIGQLSAQPLRLEASWIIGTKPGYLIKHLINDATGFPASFFPTNKVAFLSQLKTKLKEVSPLRYGWSWVVYKPSPWVGNIVFHKNMLFAQTSDGFLYCLDENSGKEKWSHQVVVLDSLEMTAPSRLEVFGEHVWWFGPQGVIKIFSLNGTLKHQLNTPKAQDEGLTFLDTPRSVLRHAEFVFVLYNQECLAISVSDFSLAWHLKGAFRSLAFDPKSNFLWLGQADGRLLNVNLEGFVEKELSHTHSGPISFLYWNSPLDLLWAFVRHPKSGARSLVSFDREGKRVSEQRFSYTLSSQPLLHETPETVCFSTIHRGPLCLSLKPAKKIGFDF
jgi:hypothetical protein